jgi:putative ABC transport system permease protein
MMAWRNFNRNRVRSLLAALGIVIGVVAIASLGMVGAAIEYSVDENLGGLTNQVTVSPGSDKDVAALTQTDVRELEALAVDEVVVPRKSTSTVLEGNGNRTRVSVVGVTRASAIYEAVAGDVPDRLRSGALVSQSLADDLGRDLGDPVVYDDTSYRIRAIVDIQTFGPGGGGTGTLVLPEAALPDQRYYGQVTVVATDGAAAVAYADRVEARFNDRREMLSVTTNEDIQAAISTFTSTLNLALIGLGSISLVVASVAILNVMLMSTIERRGEIGVLRAVGIRRREVLRMILAEAAVIGLVGGAVGALVSLGAGLALNQALFGDPTIVFGWASSQYLLFGFAFGVFASLLSGLYPAWKAANDRPVEALRG